MTYTAQFKVTEVEGNKIVAKASILPSTAQSGTLLTEGREYGTLTQNTEHAIRMELHVEIEEGYETQIKVGDTISGHGHFTA